MSNVTDISLTCEGIGDLDIFDETGLIDFNKIIPQPEYFDRITTPVGWEPLLNYLFTEFSEDEARKYVKKFEITDFDELLEKGQAEIVAATTDSFNFPEITISSYELGKIYFRGKTETGCYAPNEWRSKYWGCDCDPIWGEKYEDSIEFAVYGCAPNRIIEKLSKITRKKILVKIIFEDDGKTINTRQHSWE